MSRVAAIQMNSSEDVKDNLEQADGLVAEAVAAGAEFVVLPENFAIMDSEKQSKLAIQEVFGTGPIQTFLEDTAKRHKIWLVGGTIPISTDTPDKVSATCLLYNSAGEVVARYNKIHLFDVSISETEQYLESATIAAGDEICVVDTPFGRLGLAVCYDLRFPALFLQMLKQNVELIAVPTAFTQKTGEVHWHTLTRCRALDTFSYIIAACQTGTHTNGRQTFGHSVIVDPWGQDLSCLETATGSILSEIDLDYVHQVRHNIPLHKHQRLP